MTGQYERIIGELAARKLAREDYGEYLSYVNGMNWKRTRLSSFLAEKLQKVVCEDTGNAYDILIIETPPQHGKSITVTEAFPSWYLGKNPTHKVIIGSYNEESAQRFLRRNREKTERYGSTLFGIKMGRVNRNTEYELDKTAGRLISRGIMGGITGNQANLLLIDDPVKNRREADSETVRNALWDEWLSTLKSRLAAKAKVILIMTPWHEDDMRARLLKTEKNITRLRLPAQAEENDPLGRVPGQALCPELGKDEKWLFDYKTSYLSDPEGGARAWAALYQCSPRAEGGNVVPRKWWKYYTPDDSDKFAIEVISVDAAFKDGEKNDYVAVTVWGKRENSYYLMYCLNKHMDFPATVAAIRSVKLIYPDAQAVLIEDKANGSAIIQTLQREMFVIPVDPLGGKVSRVNAVSPAIESGHVFLPEKAPWLSDYVNQWTAFPNAAHDDMVDSSTQALSYLFRMSGELLPCRADLPEDGEEILDQDALYGVYR